MMARLMLLAFLASVIGSGHGQQCGYASCPSVKDDMINVHLVPHTHDDVGWLKTVDQYFYGSAKSITTVGVQYILDTVVPELVNDPTKRFIYVEMAFFWRWWREQDDRMRHTVKQLVNNGQLEFINGGWCMNDEAGTHYNAIIDQMTWGFRRLNDTFGECGRPRIGWQIDPFGHSKEQASLFAEMGMDGLYFGRLDYADKDKRLKDKTMEMVWEASDSLGESSSLFTGALFNGYGPPAGFCFDENCGDDPIMDDPRMHDYNKDQKVMDFMKAVMDQAKSYATNNIIMTMGSDFQYNNARVWYKNLDKLIKYVNALQTNGSKVNAFYSTPSCYTKALNDAGKTWPTKSDDFFPYASDPHAYWTGYFTSRAALKGMVRDTNNILQVCKQLGALTSQDWTPGPEGDVTALREAMGVLQHHDAVSGTAKQAVTFDYAQRLAEGIAECDEVVAYAYKYLSPKDKNGSPPPKTQFCHLLNITQCDVTENSNSFVVNVYNPLPRPVSKYVRLPVMDGSGYMVQDGQGQEVKAQLVPIPQPVLMIPGRSSKATQELVFMASDLPSVGFKSYYISKTSSSSRSTRQSRRYKLDSRKKSFIGYDKVKMVFNQNGQLTHILNLANNKAVSMQPSFGYYKGHSGNNSMVDFRASGAYIFRPDGQSPVMLDQKPDTDIIQGDLVTEVRQNFADYVSLVTRTYKDSEDIEFEWLVGPIPIDDNVGKELILKYTSELASKGEFMTDSNGRQMLMRVRDHRPTWNLNVTEPVAGNYYPVNSRIFVKDDHSQMTVLTDRSQGGTSMKDGEVELMLHRRLLYDDAFGVGEPLNETAFGKGLVVRGKHWVQIEESGEAEAAKRHRLRAQEIFMAPRLSFVPTTMSFSDWQSKFKMEYSSLGVSSLPKNVHLLTLEEWAGNSRDSVLIRLEHIFEAHEDPNGLSKPATVQLSSLFSAFDIMAVEEVILGANLNKAKLQRLKWNVASDNEVHPLENGNGNNKAPVPNDGWSVTLNAFQIRSFIVDLKAKA